MIYCVWYPCGGFGHFINAVISLYGDGFVRPQQLPKFSKDGNSHFLDLIAPAYVHDPKTYNFNFDPVLNYSVLIDNGIDNESTRFQNFFPSANIVKMCYSDFSWPVVANTLIVKVMQQNIESVLSVDLSTWKNSEPWVQREKYFLFLRDHEFRRAWKPDTELTTVMIEDLLDYHILQDRININLNDFKSFWDQWYDVNKQYFQPVLTAKKILEGKFEPVDDIWTQAVVYYQIWCKYGVEVPHNDYSNWFESYDDIVKMLNKHGVVVDQS